MIKMNKEEQIAREKAIREYLEDRSNEILDNLESLYKKYDKKIAKLF